jgi:citrate synthase
MPRKKRIGKNTHITPIRSGKGAESSQYLTAAEACSLLGVKPQTLYAYVSRGQLRPEARPGHQGNYYPRSEVESLLARSRARSGHGATAAGAMRWGEPILESAITNIQDEKLFYRGHGLNDLIRDEVPFENVAELLWSGELPVGQVRWIQPISSENIARTSLSFDATGSAVARRLLLCVSEAAFADQQGADELLDDTLRRARFLVFAVASELFAGKRRDKASSAGQISIAEWIARRTVHSSSGTAIAAVNAALIACSDHELNASTFAARVAASTGADLYAAILAGAATFSGRHHGLSPVAAYGLVESASRGHNIENQIKDALAAGRSIPGFGHPLYPHGDPRFSLLIECARGVAEEMGGEAKKQFELVSRVIQAAKRQGLQLPNLDMGLVAVVLVLGLPGAAAASLFALGRIAGWTAHVIEQRQQGFLLRPRARYVGRGPVARF